MKRVIIESPYAGKDLDDLMDKEGYLNACLRDSLKRGEAPFASHGLYTRDDVLDDNVPEERRLGITAGFAWRKAAHMTVVYGDKGVSGGMLQGIEDSIERGVPLEFRSLGDEWWMSDPGEFDERAALEWLSTHPDFGWSAKNRYCWMYQMGMMFGGVTTDAFHWNIREDDSERYIVHQGLFGDGKYVIDIDAVRCRLAELVEED